MNAQGARAAALFGSEPDIKAWADGVPLNPARVPTGHGRSAGLDSALARLAAFGKPGLAGLDELSRGMERV